MLELIKNIFNGEDFNLLQHMFIQKGIILHRPLESKTFKSSET